MTAGKNTRKDGAASGSPAGQGGGAGAEVAEEHVEVVTYAAAIDVAKGSGMVCTRVPGSRPDRKRQTVWQAEASYGSVVALMDHLRCQGIQRLVLESTSDYWRIWYYLAEAAGLEVRLVNAKDVKHLPGRGKSDRVDSVWLCKLNERGMLRRSFVPPEGIRDLRSLTRTRSRLAQDQVRHQNRVEKILEDALLKISVVISGLFGASGRRFLDALVAGETSPAALAALGDRRLKATREQLAGALTGRFREVHAFEIAAHLRLIDTINEEIARLGARIEQQLASIPGVAPACTSCGLTGGGHSPGCATSGTPVLHLVARLDEVTGVGVRNAQVIIAELGTDMSVFPTPGHAAAWARLTSRTLQSGTSARPGRTGKGNPYLRGALGQCVMAAARTDTRLGGQYRRIARRRGKQKAIVAVSRVICEVAFILIADPAARFTDPGAGYCSRANPARQTRSRIRELERLNPGMKVTLTPAEPASTAA
jgi:transposase